MLVHIQDHGLPGGLACANSHGQLECNTAQHRANHAAKGRTQALEVGKQLEMHNDCRPHQQKHLCVTQADYCSACSAADPTNRSICASHKQTPVVLAVLLAAFTPAGPLPAWGSCEEPLHASEPAGSRYLRRMCSRSPATAGLGQAGKVPRLQHCGDRRSHIRHAQY